MYGLLANAGRREDNAALGGQVAHISAAEADLLKRLGGAGSVNPTTGLPEYYSTGASSAPGTAAAATAAQGSAAAAAAAAASAMGLGAAAVSPGYGGHGMGFTVGKAPSSSGTGSGVAPAAVANAIAQNPTMYGVEGPGGIGSGAPGVAPGTPGAGFGIVTTSEGNPVTTSEGNPVMHGNLSGRVANTPILSSDIANAKFFNQLGEATEGIPNAIVAFFSQMAQAQTPQNVASTRGALAIAGPSMGSPSATFGGPGQGGLLPSQQVATSLVTPQAEAAVAPTSLKTPLPYNPLPTTLV